MPFPVPPTGASTYNPKIRDSSIVRKFASQGGVGYLALGVFDGQKTVDALDGTIALKVYYNDTTMDPPGELVLSADSTMISHDDVGKYSYDLGPALTQNRGVLTAIWSYESDGKDFTYTDYLQILDPMPQYDRLTEAETLIVDQVGWMFGDLFDSTEGGPFLMEPFQSHFDSNRIAQLMTVAVGRLNAIGNPITTFGVGGAGTVLPAFMLSVTMIGTYIEVLRHLCRSYVEIPAFQQMNITYEDRRDYLQRWQGILQEELSTYKSMVIQSKRPLLGLGNSAILVGGGIYSGSASGIFVPGMTTALVRGMRFYNAAPALSYQSFSR